MITAFQRSAFQDDAFQIGVEVGSGGDRLGDLWFARKWLQRRREEERKRREAEEEAVRASLAPPEVEIAVASAEAVITDLSALAAVPVKVAPAPLEKAREDDGLQEFLALMIKLAQAEDSEC